MPTLRIGTRRSALATTQSEWVAGELRRAIPGLTVELVFITTTGDTSTLVGEVERSSGGGSPPQSSPTSGGVIPQGGLKAMFTKELEEALLNGSIDFAVHSLKDMAATLPPGLMIGAVPQREDPRDAWISKRGVELKDLPKGARIATGAVRRQAQLRHWRSDLKIEPLRGNVDTRLKKLTDSDWDGMVLAMAGLNRLGKQSAATEPIPTDLLLPAVGQGCLAIECRDNRKELIPYLQALNHAPSHLAATAERAFMNRLSGSCQTPLAAFAEINNHALRLCALVASPSGEKVLRNEVTGLPEKAETLGHELAEKLLSQGAKELLGESGT